MSSNAFIFANLFHVTMDHKCVIKCIYFANLCFTVFCDKSYGAVIHVNSVLTIVDI